MKMTKFKKAASVLLAVSVLILPALQAAAATEATEGTEATETAEGETFGEEGLLPDRGLGLDISTQDTGEQILPYSEILQEVDQNLKGSIQVCLTEGKEGTVNAGILFYCTKVADIKGGAYVLKDAYKPSGVDLNSIGNSNDMAEAAEKLEAYAEEESGKTGVTGQDGSVIFEDLEAGVYLIRAEDHAAYDQITSSLVSIPVWSEVDGYMFYDITLKPKHTPRPDTPEKKTAPQTGLQEYTVIYLAAGILCLLGSIVIIIRRRKNGKQET